MRFMHEITNELLKAYTSLEPIDFIRDKYNLNEREAYQIQAELIEALCERERTEVAGYKISMTSKETQAIAKTHEPAYGTLLKNDLRTSHATIRIDDMFDPLIEPEIIFILKEDLSMDADEAEILKHSEIAAGIEVPDARYKDWFPNFSLQDLLVDNTATGAVVFADHQASLNLADMAKIKMELFFNDEKISEADASAVLGNPVLSVKWLVEKIAKNDQQLKKGMVISSGTFISPIRVQKGTYRVTYSQLGSCEVTFK